MRALRIGLTFWALVLAITSSLFAQQLRLLDYPLKARPIHVALSDWEGGRALSVFAFQMGPGGKIRSLLAVLKLSREGWVEAGRWPLPEGLRYVMPMRLSGGTPGWVALRGGSVLLGVYEEGIIAWHDLCRCKTAFAKGGRPHLEHHPLVRDLNGDGEDELLLPHPEYLEAYRISRVRRLPVPLWRGYWSRDKKPLPRHEQRPRGHRIPAYSFADVEGDGRPEWILERGDALAVTRLPEWKPRGFSLLGRRRALALRGGLGDLPSSLKAAIEALPGRSFDTAEEFLAAVFQGAPAEGWGAWAPFLLGVLQLAGGEPPATVPYRVSYPDLGEFDPEDDRLDTLALTDMDGDRVLDALHAKITDFDSRTGRETRLRWFPGRIRQGRLVFLPAPFDFESDAGSFAAILHPRPDRRPPLALLLASTEVSFGSYLKALASDQVTLDIRILPWKRGGLRVSPELAREMAFEGLRQKGRRAMFFAVDFNGDGFRDFAHNLVRSTLTVYLSRGAPPDFRSPRVLLQGVELPSRPARILVEDLDGDGREEVIAWYHGKHHGPLGEQVRAIRLLDKGQP